MPDALGDGLYIDRDGDGWCLTIENYTDGFTNENLHEAERRLYEWALTSVPEMLEAYD